MKHHLLILTAAVALGLSSTGCQHEGAYAPVNTTQYDLENELNAVLLDPGAQRSVTFTGIQKTHLPDGRLKIISNFRNRENRRIQVQVNCVFKDEQGFPVEEMPFRTLILTENAQEAVEFVSLNDKARTYTIRVRQAR